MNADDLLKALDLPRGSRVDQRVPKKLLLENGAPTAADRRRINDGIEELVWLAALKPTTVGVPEYRDAQREYLEIAVLRLSLRPSAKAPRVVELVHRAIPYPVLLLTEQGARMSLSAALLRWAQNEAGRTVLDGELVLVDCAAEEAVLAPFRDALALGRQPRASLHALYQGWIRTLLALAAARVTGAFRLTSDPTRQTALTECARLDAEVARLRAAAACERQIARQVEINLELKRVQAAHAAARDRL